MGPTATRTVLVVDSNIEHADVLVGLFRSAGYRATGVGSFEVARNLLKSPPALLISAVRLGAFNGLHLIVHGRYVRPDMRSIVTADENDRTLAAEAGALGVPYLVWPLQPGPLLALISRLFEAPANDAPKTFDALYMERRACERRGRPITVGLERRTIDRRHSASAP